MDSNLLAVIGTLGGVSLGFILNEIAGLWKQRREDRRLLRRALFRLIDLHHTISPFDSEQVSLALHNWIQSKDPNSADKIDPIELNSMFKNVIETFVTPIKLESLDDMKESYEKAVLDIAEIYPLLAFSLSGRSRYPSVMDRYFESVSPLLPQENINYEKSSEVLISATKNILNNQLRNTLENDIRKVAKKIGLWTKYSINKYLKNKNKEFDSEFRQKIIKHLDDILLIMQKKVEN